MNYHSIRRRAEDLVASLNVTSLPVRPERVAKQLGLDVVKMDLDQDISGLLVVQGAHARICVRKSDAVVRQRFTIAHEIGHFSLSHLADDEHVHVDRGFVIRMRSPKSSTGKDRVEVEANQFAASLLMPERLVREAAERYGRPPLSDVAVAGLAELFEVSEQAMTIRLTVLRLL